MTWQMFKQYCQNIYIYIYFFCGEWGNLHVCCLHVHMAQDEFCQWVKIMWFQSLTFSSSAEPFKATLPEALRYLFLELWYNHFILVCVVDMCLWWCKHKIVCAKIWAASQGFLDHLTNSKERERHTLIQLLIGFHNGPFSTVCSIWRNGSTIPWLSGW